jgi:hypothetical protein
MLRVEEASWLRSAYCDLETILHAHLPSVDPSTRLVLMRAGRIVIPETPDLPGAVGALLGIATQLPLLTERVARANPDPIRRDDPRYRDAAGAAEPAHATDAADE